MKTCSTCKEEKPLEDFCRNSNGCKNGCAGRCKKCHVESRKKKYREDPEYRERAIQRTRKFIANNPDYAKTWVENNRDKNRANAHKGQIKRRAQMRDVEFDPSVNLNETFKRFEGVCGICDGIMTREQATIDHIHPISKGGSHIWDNIQLAHQSCNSRKGNAVGFIFHKQ